MFVVECEVWGEYEWYVVVVGDDFGDCVYDFCMCCCVDFECGNWYVFE